MGTTYSVKVVVPNQMIAQVQTLHPKIDEALERVNEQMSTYRSDSELSRFNDKRNLEPFKVSPATAEVVKQALDIGGMTEGAFDVTLAPLIRLWGFDRGERRTLPPSDSEIAAVKKLVGLEHVGLEGQMLLKRIPAVEVNLSGIAKGHGVDVIGRLLERHQFSSYLVEIGGEVRARGRNGAGDLWRIGINVPRSEADPSSVEKIISLDDRSMATSGDYRNYFESGGKRYSHIIDPTTGRPIRHDLVSVTTTASTCATADAYATAFLVLGEARSREVLARLPGVEAFFIHANGPGGSLRSSGTTGFTKSQKGSETKVR